MKVIRYNISNRSEECDCPQCGSPLFIGDHAYQIAPDGEAGFCSGFCAQDYKPRAMDVRSIDSDCSDESLERILQGLARDLVALSACRAHGYDACPACTGETA